MKKLIYVAAAAAALMAGGAFAQGDAECQAGAAYGPKPGCDSAATPPASAYYGNRVYGNSGWTPEQAYGGNYGNVLPYVLGSALGGVLLNDGRWVSSNNYAYNTPYPRTRRDRDGDGVPNWQDRYPDDPRRW